LAISVPSNKYQTSFKQVTTTNLQKQPTYKTVDAQKSYLEKYHFTDSTSAKIVSVNYRNYRTLKKSE